eukprot:Gb_33096 [translate_table: standard]
MESPNLDFSHSISSGIDNSLALLEPELNDVTSKKSEDVSCKSYMIFDQSSGSRRIFFDPHASLSTTAFWCKGFQARPMCVPNFKPESLNETVALGIAAFEKAKALRTSSSPVLPFGSSSSSAENGNGAYTEVESDKVNCLREPDNVSCYSHEDTQELETLLASDDEDYEVTSTVTLSDADETGYDSVASNDLDTEFWFKNSRKRRRDSDGQVEQMEDQEIMLNSTWDQSKTESIKKKMKVLSSIIGGNCMDTTALFDEAIRLVKTLQHQVRSNLL